MKLLIVQPASLFYAWQIEVQIMNFRSNGINLNDIHYVCTEPATPEIRSIFNKLAEAYPAQFYFYPDTRITHNYISSIRPHLIAQHYELFEDECQTVFYIDCDVLLSRPLDLEALSFKYPNINLFSDTIGYTGSKYLEEKHSLEIIYNIMQADIRIARNTNMHMGGAQMILHRLTAEFWRQIEWYCEAIYPILKAKETTPHEIQSWMTDGYVMNGMMIKESKSYLVTKDLDFSWPMESYGLAIQNPLFHNAGVVKSNNPLLFYKGDYQNKLPYEDVYLNTYDETKGTKIYLDAIRNIAKYSVLL